MNIGIDDDVPVTPTENEPSQQLQVWGELMRLFSERKLVPAVFDKVYDGLEEVARGLDDLEKRRTWGKAVVRVRDTKGNEDAKL
jgi:NADPH2:quinone reductase